MKELYMNAELEVVKFAIEDVITTSGAAEEETTKFVPYENTSEGDYGAWD